MFYHECLYPPFQSAVGIGHDVGTRQKGEVREEGRVNKRSKREVPEEGKSKMCQCIHWEVGAH